MGCDGLQLGYDRLQGLQWAISPILFIAFSSVMGNAEHLAIIG